MNSWAVKLDSSFPLHGPFATFGEAKRFAASHEAITIYRMVAPHGTIETSPRSEGTTRDS